MAPRAFPLFLLASLLAAAAILPLSFAAPARNSSITPSVNPDWEYNAKLHAFISGGYSITSKGVEYLTAKEMIALINSNIPVATTNVSSTNAAASDNHPANAEPALPRNATTIGGTNDAAPHASWTDPWRAINVWHHQGQLGDPVRLSHDLLCTPGPGENSCKIKGTWSTTNEVRFISGIDIGAGALLKALSGINFGVEIATSTTSSIEYEPVIHAGERGYLAFQPYNVNTGGVLTRQRCNAKVGCKTDSSPFQATIPEVATNREGMKHAHGLMYIVGQVSRWTVKDDWYNVQHRDMPHRFDHQTSARIGHVFSPFECAHLAERIGGASIAVWREDMRSCHFKMPVQHKAHMHDKWGNYIGFYDTDGYDKDNTGEWSRVQQWIDRGECDAIVRENGRDHWWCKGYSYCEPCVMMFKKR